MRCWLMIMFDHFRFRNSRMNWIDMSLSMSWRSKSFSTVWTLIGFHSSVKSHMAFQGVFTQKLVLAYVTFNWIWNNKNSGCNKSTSTIFNFFINYISAMRSCCFLRVNSCSYYLYKNHEKKYKSNCICYYISLPLKHFATCYIIV